MDQLDKIENKLDRVLDRLGEHDTHLVKIDERLGFYNSQLEIHIKRSTMLEDQQVSYESKTNKQLETALLPIKSAKFLVKVAAGILTILTVLKFIGNI